MTEGRIYYADCRFMLDIKLNWTNNYAKCGKWNICSSCGKYQTLRYPGLYRAGCPYNCPDFEKKETL